MKIFYSHHNDPFVNQAMEEGLVQNHQQGEMTLFLWQNDACICLGRFQNPWQEAPAFLLAENKIPVMRRLSGGGCVFHDLGNINFSFIMDPKVWTHHQRLEFISKAIVLFLGHGGNLSINERHDIYYGDKKISGSAFREMKGTQVHHGTLLVSSDLNFLSSCLKSTLTSLIVEDRSRPSTRAKVTSLKQENPHLSLGGFSEFINCVEKVFKSKAEEIRIEGLKGFEGYYAQMKKRDWIWGRTPDFKIKFKGKMIQIREGKVN
jgi:lipoate-protein ligase A